MARKRRTMNPELARQRRMSAYPQEMWAILQAAIRGEEYKRTFATHNLATAILARFYRFRMDALECRVSGAIYLRDVMVVGVDSLGGTFNTRNPGAGPPYELTWTYIGTGDSREAAARQDLADKQAGGQLQPPVGVQPGIDATEAFLEKVLLSEPSQAKEISPEELARHEAARKDMELPADLNQALCDHEWDVTDTHCLKCKAPKP